MVILQWSVEASSQPGKPMTAHHCELVTVPLLTTILFCGLAKRWFELAIRALAVAPFVVDHTLLSSNEWCLSMPDHEGNSLY